MTDSVQPLTAKAKLAMSRAALLGAMGYEEIKSEIDSVPDLAELPKPVSRSPVSAIGARISQSVVGRWWYRHPLSSVVELGEPFLERYAQKHPGKLMAYGAGTGALLWVLKPWKLLSAATVVTLILKSSDVSGMVADLVRRTMPAGGDASPPPTGNERPLPRTRP